MATFRADEVMVSNKRGAWPAGLAPAIRISAWLDESAVTRDLFRALVRQRSSDDVMTFARSASRCISVLLRKESDTALLDHWYFPDETLMTGSGDCEDHALLLARVLMYEPALADKVLVCFGYVAHGGVVGQHAWVQIALGDGTYGLLDPYLETVLSARELKYQLAATLTRDVLTILTDKTPQQFFEWSNPAGLGKLMKRAAGAVGGAASAVGGAVSDVAGAVGGAASDAAGAVAGAVEGVARDKIYAALEKLALERAASWRDNQPAGSDADFDDCVTVVAAGLAAGAAAVGAAYGAPAAGVGAAVGAAVGAVIGTGGGIPLAQIACRRVLAL